MSDPVPPPSGDVDEALAWFRDRTGAVDDLAVGDPGPTTLVHAAVLVRAALARAKKEGQSGYGGNAQFHMGDGEWTDEERGFVEEALRCTDADSAGHWPTVAGWLACEVRRVRAALAADTDTSAQTEKLDHLATLNDVFLVRDALAELCQDAEDAGRGLRVEDVRAMLGVASPGSSPPAGDTTTETTTDYRVVEVAPESRIKSDWYGEIDRAHRKARDWQRLGYEHLVIETRTRSVSTTRTESPWEAR